MLRIFKQNDISTAFVLVLVTLLLKFKYILNPPPIESIEHFQQCLFFSFDGLKSFYEHHASIYVFFSVCMLFIFSLYFNSVINNEKFFQKKSFLPALVFIIFSSILPSLNVFSTIFIANVLIFMAFANTMKLYTAYNTRKACFNIGMLVSSATLFYFPSILFFILFIVLLLLLRPFVLQENVAYLLGLFTPIYLGLAIVFLQGHWHQMGQLLFLHLTPPLKISSNKIFIILTLVSIILVVYGLFLVNQSSGKNTISVRKKWNAVVFYLIFASIVGLFSKVFPSLPWLIAITPISIILSQTLHNNKEKFNIFTLYFLILIVIVVQWLL